jgi:hypothetical protein
MKFLNAHGFRIDYREYAKDHTIEAHQELPEIREWLRMRCRF